MMSGVMSFPEHITNVNNYVRAFVEGNFITGFMNTVVLVVISVPVTIIIYVFLQRHIISGVTDGAVK